MFEYNIENLTNGILIMFRSKDSEQDDYGCDISMEFIFSESDQTWFLTNLKSGSFMIPSINKMLREILAGVNKKEITDFDELVRFCNEMGNQNSDIFSYEYIENNC